MIMKEKSPKVSVIIPTYNRAHLVGRAIQSVLNQTYQDFEIILVDDGSTDNTAEVIKKFQEKEKRIRYIKQARNKGAGAARNSGIKAARGEYIAFQDSDDEWFPEKLEKQIRVFENAPAEVGVVYTDMQRIYRDGRIKYWHSPIVTPENIINTKTLDYQVSNIGILSALIKKECFDRVGLFDVKFPRFIDLEFFIRLSKYYHFYLIREPLVKYYDTEGISSNTKTISIARRLLLEKYFKDIKQNKKFLAKQYFDIGFSLCSNGDFQEGKDYLIKAVKANPLNVKFLLALFLSFFGQSVFNRAIAGYRKVKNIKVREEM